MRKVFIILAGCLLFALLALIIAFSLAIEEAPLINRAVILAPEHIARAKQIIHAHRDWVRPGTVATLRIVPADADLAANYLAHRLARGSARVTVGKGSAAITLSIPLASTPLSWLNGYLNIKANLLESGHLPELQSLQIGKIQLPSQASKIIGKEIERWLRRGPEYREGLDALRRVKMSQNELAITYQWTGALPRLSKEVKSSMVGESERERFLYYQTLLATYSHAQDSATSLAKILPLLMQAASARSRDEDASAENRAVILVVAFHVLGLPLERLLPEAASWLRSPPQTVTLGGRDDFAKHFMVSALIAAYADTALSDVVGLYKEIEDSRVGSGFSFNDLAADRAGTRFGEKAVANSESAEALQLRVAPGIEDRDLMPEWRDLPEFMPEEEFKRRFGGIGEPAYQAMMARIEERVDSLGVLK
jgi:hypothetical protein